MRVGGAQRSTESKAAGQAQHSIKRAGRGANQCRLKAAGNESRTNTRAGCDKHLCSWEWLVGTSTAPEKLAVGKEEQSNLKLPVFEQQHSVWLHMTDQSSLMLLVEVQTASSIWLRIGVKAKAIKAAS